MGWRFATLVSWLTATFGRNNGRQQVPTAPNGAEVRTRIQNANTLGFIDKSIE